MHWWVFQIISLLLTTGFFVLIFVVSILSVHRAKVAIYCVSLFIYVPKIVQLLHNNYRGSKPMEKLSTITADPYL